MQICRLPIVHTVTSNTSPAGPAILSRPKPYHLTRPQSAARLVNLLDTSCRVVAHLVVAGCIKFVFELVRVLQTFVEIEIGRGLVRRSLGLFETFWDLEIPRRAVRDLALLGESETLFLACLTGAAKDTSDDLDAAKTVKGQHMWLVTMWRFGARTCHRLQVSDRSPT